MRSYTLILALLIGQGCQAQLLDSIALFAKEPPRPIIRLDVKGSFVSNSNVRMVGLKLGLEHARRFQYGVGYSFLFSPVERIRYIEGFGPMDTRLRMGYLNAYVDYAFYQRGPWEMRIPVQLGYGRGSVMYENFFGRKQPLYRSGLFLYEPCMTVQYRFLKYFGIGAGWGYRLVIHTRERLDERLTAPIYTFGLRIFFEELYHDLQGG